MEFRFVALAIVASMLGCSSAMKSSSPKFLNSAQYENRKNLKTSLFGASNSALGARELNTILDSKISFNWPARVAVMRIKQKYQGQSWGHFAGHSWSTSAFVLDKKLVTQFIGELESSDRIAEVILLPNLMIPNELSIEAIRNAAARVQADLILVMKPESFVDYEVRLFEKNQAKAQSTIEAIFLDVRTGVIPYTAIATETLLIKSRTEDLNRAETMRRVQQEAEGKAMVKTAKDLSKFISSLK